MGSDAAEFEAEIRRATEAHVPEMLELLHLGLREQEAFAAACEPPEDAGFLDAEIAEHRAGLADHLEEWRVGVDGEGRVRGLLWLRFATDRLGRYGTVRQIVVHPTARGRGLGRRLLGAAEAEVRASDAVMLLISALRPNPAGRLYRALGFDDFPDGFREDRNPEHVVLWKWLGEGAPPHPETRTRRTP